MPERPTVCQVRLVALPVTAVFAALAYDRLAVSAFLEIDRGGGLRMLVLLDARQHQEIVDQAPHPNAAELFMDWFLSPVGQKALADALLLHSPRPDVPPPGGADTVEILGTTLFQNEADSDLDGVGEGGNLWSRAATLESTLLAGGVSGDGVFVGYRFVAATAGGRHTCAKRLDGVVTCFGDDSRGQSMPLQTQPVALTAGLEATAGTPGMGLGLTITKLLATVLGGEITLANLWYPQSWLFRREWLLVRATHAADGEPR